MEFIAILILIIIIIIAMATPNSGSTRRRNLSIEERASAFVDLKKNDPNWIPLPEGDPGPELTLELIAARKQMPVDELREWILSSHYKSGAWLSDYSNCQMECVIDDSIRAEALLAGESVLPNAMERAMCGYHILGHHIGFKLLGPDAPDWMKGKETT